MKKILLIIPFCMLTSSVQAAIPKANGAWVYDTLYDDAGNQTGKSPGLFSTEINNYNIQATESHKLKQIFPYGGDIAMYCGGSGGSSSNTTCTTSNMKVGYNIESVQAYYENVTKSANPVDILPIVDGVVGGRYLKNFNTMGEYTAKLLADVVAKKYCADSNIIGVQFDIERFDISQPGQRYFYKQIAKNFAGMHSPGSPDPYHCVDANHPQGRIFSVFAPSGKVNGTLANILNAYNNGFVVAPLYSLGTTTGSANSPSEYAEMVRSEVRRMVSRGSTYGVKYQFGIPASASIQEFEKYGTTSGYSQIEYVKKALEVINANARSQPEFLGISLWAFRSNAFRNNIPLRPAKPSSSVKTYLASRLQ